MDFETNLCDEDFYNSSIEVTVRDYYYCCETRLRLRIRLLSLDYIIKQIFNASQISKDQYHNSKVYFLEAGGLYIELVDNDESSTFQNQNIAKKCSKSLRWNDVLALRYTYDNIGLKLNLFGISAEFKFNQSIINKVKQLSNVYVGWRAVRGDGNCYYRAVIFKLMETLIETRNSNGFQVLATLCTQLLTELSEDAQEKDPLRISYPGKDKNLGVSDCSDISRINSVLVHLNKLKNGKGWTIIRKFESDWLNPAILLDHNFILFARLLVSRYIIRNQDLEIFGLPIKDAILPSYPDCSNITDYCMKHIEAMGTDAEGVVVSGGLLLTALRCSGCAVFLDRREDVKLSVTSYNYPIPVQTDSPPASAPASEKNENTSNNQETGNNNSGSGDILADIHVLLRPGHYDLLYLHDGVSSLPPLERLARIEEMVASTPPPPPAPTPTAAVNTASKVDTDNKSTTAATSNKSYDNNDNNNEVVKKAEFSAKEAVHGSRQLSRPASVQTTSSTPKHTTRTTPPHSYSDQPGYLYSELLHTPKRLVIQYFDMHDAHYIHGRRQTVDDVILLRQHKAYIPIYTNDTRLERFTAEIRNAFSIANTTPISFVSENKLQLLLFPSDFPALKSSSDVTPNLKYDADNLLFNLKDNSSVTLEMDDVITFWVDIVTAMCTDHFLVTLDCTRAFGSSYKEYETKLFAELLLDYLIPSFSLKEEFDWILHLDVTKLNNGATATKDIPSVPLCLFDGCHILIEGVRSSGIYSSRNQPSVAKTTEADEAKGSYNLRSKHNVQANAPTVIPSAKTTTMSYKDIVGKYSNISDDDDDTNKHHKNICSRHVEAVEQNEKYDIPMDVGGVHPHTPPPRRGSTSTTSSPSSAATSPLSPVKSAPGPSPPSYRDALAMTAAAAARTSPGSAASGTRSPGSDYGSGYTGTAADDPSSSLLASCQATLTTSGTGNTKRLCQRTASPPSFAVITVRACGHSVCSRCLEDHLLVFCTALNVESIFYFPANQVLRVAPSDDLPEPILRFARCPVEHCPALLSSGDVEPLPHYLFWLNTAVEGYSSRSPLQHCCFSGVRHCSTSAKHIDEMCVLACGHVFHPICLVECIRLQFRRSRNDRVPFVCPACELYGSHCVCNSCQLRGLQRLYFEHLISPKEFNNIVIRVSSASIFGTNDAETLQQLQSHNMNTLLLLTANGVVSIVCSCVPNKSGASAGQSRVVPSSQEPRKGRCLRCSGLYCLECFTKEHFRCNCEEMKLLKLNTAWNQIVHWNGHY